MNRRKQWTPCPWNGNNRSEPLDKAPREPAVFLLMKLYSILSNVHQYSRPDNTVLQCVDVKNWSSAFGLPLAVAGFPAKSASVLTSTLPTTPERRVLTLDDGSEFVTENTLTTKLVPDQSVYIFAL